ncbi:MAG: hypothetical protein ACRC91_04745 [Aeromonas sp.]
MKSVDVKKGLRVVVTHRSSIHRGKFGTITSVHLKTFSKNVDFVIVKFENENRTAVFSVGSIQLADDVPDVKKPTNPYKVGDLIEATNPIEISGRKAGDVYEITVVSSDLIHFKYVSGNKPVKSWDTGSLRLSEMDKYWKPHVKSPEKHAVTLLPTKPYAGMYLRSLTKVETNRCVGDILQVEKVFEDGSLQYNNITKLKYSLSVVAHRYNNKQFQFVSESEAMQLGVAK